MFQMESFDPWTLGPLSNFTETYHFRSKKGGWKIIKGLFFEKLMTYALRPHPELMFFQMFYSMESFEHLAYSPEISDTRIFR